MTKTSKNGKDNNRKDETQPVSVDKAKAEKQCFEQQRFSKQVSQKIISRLGNPPDLDVIQVIPLYNDRYRVNVMVRSAQKGDDLAFSRIRVAHSYFASIDASGDIKSASPDIKKIYA